jgi:glycosyltransferase involved in cell wall biosynthesis
MGEEGDVTMKIEQKKVLPRVTIMIPTYGQKDTILQAIDSALAQDYPNLEVVVADDASPDSTGELVATRIDPRLVYHRNPVNLGRVGNYRNTLYSVATGNWVVNLDGDDYFTDPSFISSAIDLATSDSEILIVTARCKTLTPSRSIVSDIPTEQIVDGKEVVLQVSDSRFRFFHMATVYNRAKAIECDFYRVDVLSSDWESLYRLAARGKVAYLDRVIGVWRLHGNNDSLSANWRVLRDNLKIWQPVYDEAIRNGVSPDQAKKAKQAILFLLAYLNISAILGGANRSDAIRFLLSLREISFALFCRVATYPKFLVKLVLSFAYPKHLKKGL